jgi:hypothetical protein
METKHEYVLRCTELLRNSPDPMWRRTRELLEERGVAPATSILATSFPDDTSFEFGVVVTSDRRVFQFGFDYLHTPVERGVFTEWVDLTDRHAASPYRDDVATALDVLSGSAGPSA